MGNVFPPNRKIHETYDLKGSLVGRESLPKKDGTMPSILKDLNFLNNKQKLKLGPEKSALFVQQIKKDSDVSFFSFYFKNNNIKNIPPTVPRKLQYHGLQFVAWHPQAQPARGASVGSLRCRRMFQF